MAGFERFEELMWIFRKRLDFDIFSSTTMNDNFISNLWGNKQQKKLYTGSSECEVHHEWIEVCRIICKNPSKSIERLEHFILF